jgi:uncharacterized membrane protein
MSWAVRFQLRQHLRQSLWAVPLVGAAVGAVLAITDRWLEDRVSLPPGWSYSASTATSVLSTVSGAMIGLIGLVVTIGVLVVQMATGTLSPRFMRLWYRDRLQKVVLASFTATFVFSFALLREVGEGQVPDVGISVAGLAVTIDLILLLTYLDRFVHALRPVAVASAMARSGLSVIADMEERAGTSARAGGDTVLDGTTPSLRVHAATSGAIQAMYVRGIMALAEQRDLTCALRHSVGDFVNVGTALMDVYGASRPADEEKLRGMVALGHERTIDQDPAFAVRIIVDIAIRALSPAVNDPTTATQMINHLGALLAGVGSRDLQAHGALVDSQGVLRVTVPMRTWDNYLELGISEIRKYGATSAQVCRRLRAMLADLETTVTPANQPAVRRQLAVLDASVTNNFAEGEARTLALVSDRQGIGGPSMAPEGHRVRG